MLRAERLIAGYDGAPVIRNVSLDVQPGEIFCLLGANGAGKSTIAKVLAGAQPLTSGQVTIDDQDITQATANKRVRIGLSFVPETRNLFGRSTVRDNILLGGVTRSRVERRQSFNRVLDLFPQLPALLKNRARDLSGGEQQMVAVGRALMAEPRYLILDEPSLGLAPVYVDAILDQARSLADAGVGVLLIEQNVGKALDRGNRGAVIDSGRLVLRGSAEELSSNPAVIDAYLGVVA